MYFANARYLKAQALRLVDEQVADEEEGGVAAHRLQFLVLDLSPVLTVDVSAALILGELHRDLHKRGIRVSRCPSPAAPPLSHPLCRSQGSLYGCSIWRGEGTTSLRTCRLDGLNRECGSFAEAVADEPSWL